MKPLADGSGYKNDSVCKCSHLLYGWDTNGIACKLAFLLENKKIKRRDKMATSSFTRRFYVSKRNSNKFFNALTTPVVEQKKITNLPPIATEEDLKAITKALAKYNDNIQNSASV